MNNTLHNYQGDVQEFTFPASQKKALSLGSVRKVGSQAEAYARHAYHRSKAAC